MSTKEVIEKLIDEALEGPNITRRLRSGSQMLYKGTPIKFLGKSESGIYKIAFLNKDSGEWIPKSISYDDYTRLRKSTHKYFKYNFSIDMRNYT